MSNALNLKPKNKKSILTVAEGYGCGIFSVFRFYLQHLSHSRDGSNYGF
jgi:hypothetical protein